MNNFNAKDLLIICEEDLLRIEKVIDVLTGTNPAVPYLTKYSIIKVCGTIEQCFKMIISDIICDKQNKQVIKYINRNFKESSINPSLNNIHNSLISFDEDWNNAFKAKLNSHKFASRLKSSLKSLNAARNQFAHGGNPTLTFKDVKNYYEDAKLIVEFIDDAVK